MTYDKIKNGVEPCKLVGQLKSEPKPPPVPGTAFILGVSILGVDKLGGNN